MAVLDAVSLVDVTRGDLLAAGTQGPLRLNDAIHLATALMIGAEDLITYDDELPRASATAGIRVVAPASEREVRTTKSQLACLLKPAPSRAAPNNMTRRTQARVPRPAASRVSSTAKN